ncbi:hypothetical protein GCM10009823_21760 [Brevibacterium salitolerans]|uniref:Uncharacterized protein n=1 Tax=Brevibacterium salitolerans TaxID=1403566 RepID=A0ABP5IGX3_9MICO
MAETVLALTPEALSGLKLLGSAIIAVRTVSVEYSPSPPALPPPVVHALASRAVARTGAASAAARRFAGMRPPAAVELVFIVPPGESPVFTAHRSRRRGLSAL